MAQQIYTSIGGKQKNKGRRIAVVIICVVAAFFVGIGVIGLITDSQSSAHLEVSEAIAENVQLKQQIDYLNGEVERLNGEIERLGGELAARPTAAPETPASPEPTAAPDTVSPRNYYGE